MVKRAKLRRLKKGAAAYSSNAERLERIEAFRDPFLPAWRSLITKLWQECPPREPGIVLDVGAGIGGLRALLPSELEPELLHIDPDVKALAKLKQRFPNAKTLSASAEELPLVSASVERAILLCLADVLPETRTVLDELARVIAPQGYVLLLLDMSPSRVPLFPTLLARDLLPLPNVLTDAVETEWPQDLIVAHTSELKTALASYQAARERPLAELTALLQAASGENAFVSVYNGITGNTARSELLASDLNRLQNWLSRHAASLTMNHISSAQLLSEQLDAWINEHPSFELLSSGIRTAHTLEKRTTPAEPAYESISVGNRRRQPSVPRVLLDSDVPLPSEDETLRELGVLVHAARRL